MKYLFLLALIASPVFAQTTPQQDAAIKAYKDAQAAKEKAMKSCIDVAVRTKLTDPAKVIEEQGAVYSACMAAKNYPNEKR